MKNSLKKLRASTSYIIPSILVFIYIVVTIIMKIIGKQNDWYNNTMGFTELCKSLVGFTTVILGIYGVVVPIVIGKMTDEVGKIFWSLIDKDKFITDVKRIIISGIVHILFCSLLLIYDILSQIIVTVFICIAIWTLVFFMFSSYRFIGIFMNLISADKKIEKIVQDDLSDAEKESLKNVKKL